MNTKQVEFAPSNYFKEETKKKQIYLHHTAGNGDAEAVFKYWASTKDRVATCVAIGTNGLIAQGFSSRYWGYHLGLKQGVFNSHGVPYQSLDKLSIGVEICNWGYLKEAGKGKFVNYVGREIPKKDVIKLDAPYKGFQFWHSYTKEQIESTKELLLYWNETYGIPLDYNEDIWAVSKRALAAEPGVYTHNSVRKDKTDVYPHPELIEMLKSL
jgi:N-acetyl-anhydromuramyl-L-alanine amidase AmpD